MSLKEWKNNELNRQLLKKFGILKENKKPDFLDLDKDGDKEESMADAAKDNKEDLEESTSSRHSDADRRQGKDREYADRLREVDGDDEEEVVEEGELPDGLKKYQKNNKKMDPKKDSDDDKPPKGAPPAQADSDEDDKEEVNEGDDKSSDEEQLYRYDKNGKIVPVSKSYKAGQKVGKFIKGKKPSLQEALKKIAKAKKVFLNGKRIK